MYTDIGDAIVSKVSLILRRILWNFVVTFPLFLYAINVTFCSEPATTVSVTCWWVGVDSADCTEKC